ncbi:MAG: hypothetical protein JWM36_694 [Hyphomicrobiales bacterium]|nr:hypothetical protein [Hyphomicrobiales bacterium]
MNIHVQNPPNPRQVLEDRKWQLRDAAREILALVQWHSSMADQYLEAGCDFLALHHTVEARRCMLVFLANIKELRGLSESGGNANG